MSNKTDATWHPNSGPTTDHTGLIARAEAYVKPRPGLPTDSPNYDLVRKLLAALADLVPREKHDDLLGVARLTQSAFITAERERDEARAERDALAHVLEQVRALRNNVYPGATLRGLDAALNQAPSVSFARHDAEVKAQALDEAVADLLEQFPTYGTNGTTAGWLLDRSAAMRAEANDHSN